MFGRIQATYTQARWDAALSYQFSGSKLPEEYSYGGEDGLEETPIINPSTEDPMLRYAGTPAWGVTNFLVNFKKLRAVAFSSGTRKHLRPSLPHFCFRDFCSGAKCTTWTPLQFLGSESAFTSFSFRVKSVFSQL